MPESRPDGLMPSKNVHCYSVFVVSPFSVPFAVSVVAIDVGLVVISATFSAAVSTGSSSSLSTPLSNRIVFYINLLFLLLCS